MIQDLADWFEASHRRLPWRESYDPYHVWVSEVMLQQTRVETVVPYYNRFLERFPGLKDLAAAEENEVLLLWSGLGYYNRARNFQEAARRVVHDHNGTIPKDYDTLLALPGIGRYMAGAIMSIGFNEPYPIVDGNVRRVLSRLNGWSEGNPKSLWIAATEMVESAEPRSINQAMMELGATICTFKAPKCTTCPLRDSCRGYISGNPENIPVPRRRKKTVHVHLMAVIDRNKRGFLMQEMNGFWEFPTFDELPAGLFQRQGNCRHTITHHRIVVDVYRGRLGKLKGYRRMAFENLPATSLTRKIHRVIEDKK